MPAKSFAELVRNKEKFLVAVYAILIAQLVSTFTILKIIRNHPKLSATTRRYFWAWVLLSFTIILLTTFLPMPSWVKLLMFSAFSVVVATVLNAASYSMPQTLINQALISTIALFVALSAFAIVLAAWGIDMGWMGVYLLAALIALIIASMVHLIYTATTKEVTKPLYKALVVVGMVLFSMLVVYDTNVILQKDYNKSAVDAALDFYLSFMNLFVRTVSLDAS